MTIKRKHVFVDSTFAEIYMQTHRVRLDFEKLLHFVEQDEDTVAEFTPLYFFQKSDKLDWSTYRYLIQTLERIGWVVDPCLDQSIRNTAYAPAMESSRLLARMFATACEALDHDDEVEFVLGVNHLSYVPALKILRERYDFITLTLLCNKADAHDDLLKTFDNVVDAADLDLTLEGASVPEGIGRQ